MEWIDIKDRQPEIGLTVIGCCSYSKWIEVYIITMNKDGEFDTSEDANLPTITHWMPLPPHISEC